MTSKIKKTKLCWLCSPGISLQNNRGVTTVMILLFLVLLAAMAPLIIQRTVMDTAATGNYRQGKQTLYIADAGINHGMNVLYTSATDGLNAELAAGTLVTNNPYNNGSYTVTVMDNEDGDGSATTDSDKIILVNSTATFNGDTKVIQSMIRAIALPWSPETAVLTDGELEIAGDSTVGGTAGNVHANGKISLTGSAFSISGSLTSAGEIDPLAVAQANSGSAAENAPNVYVPPNVANLAELRTTMQDLYKDKSDYIFKNDGSIIRQSDNADVSGTGDFAQWSYNASEDRWSFNSNPTQMTDGMYYFEDSDVHVQNAKKGSALTFIVEGNINLTGLDFTNYKDASDPEGIQDTAVFALHDLTWHSNPTLTVNGFMYCGQQFDVQGAVKITGALIGKDFATDANYDGTDLADKNILTGNAEITYAGGLDTPFPEDHATLTVLNWREL